MSTPNIWSLPLKKICAIFTFTCVPRKQNETKQIGNSREEPEADLLRCVTLLDSLCLEDLLRPSPLMSLQADPIHLVEEHREKTSLYAVWCLTVWPRANQWVNLIEEQDAWSAGPGLMKQLHGDRQTQGLVDETQGRTQSLMLICSRL